MIRFIYLFSFIASFFLAASIDAFHITTNPTQSIRHTNPKPSRPSVLPLDMAASVNDGEGSNSHNVHFLMQEFCLHSGEVLNPYETLQVPRTAVRSDIRQAYISKSKIFHPDQVRHASRFPEQCSSLEDVREQWERINFAYEILSDRKTRHRYNRHEVLADPGAAMGRAAQEALVRGTMGFGHMVFRAAAFAYERMSDTPPTAMTGMHDTPQENPPLTGKLAQFVLQHTL